MLDRTGFSGLFLDAVRLSDAIYESNDGQPTEHSQAVREILQFDSDLQAVSGLASPIRGAYFDAECKTRALNDLVRSAAKLLDQNDTNIGFVSVLRAAIETAARLYWVIAPDGDHLDRAGRFLRERLRSVREVAKLNDEARSGMSVIRTAILAGADRADIPVPEMPAAVDLVADLVSRPGVLSLGGINLGEAAAVFYRLPSAATHAAIHGIAPHYADPTQDATARRTIPEPWEQTLAMGGGLYASYITTHRALLVLYGWDTAEWDRLAHTGGMQIEQALSAERQVLAASDVPIADGL